MAAPCLIASEKRTARLCRWSWVFGDTEWTLTFSSNPRQKKQESWRREWDSNPRYGFPYTRFPSVRLQPLGHLSHQPILRVQRICRPQDLPRSEHMKQRRKDTD